MTSNDRTLTAPLLRLPLELRNEIWSMLLLNFVAIPLSTQGVRTKSSRVVRNPDIHWSKQYMFAEPPNTGLLRINRQIHTETIAFLYSINRFVVKDILTLRRFLETIGPGVTHITGVTLQSDALMGRSLSSAMPKLRLCRNLTSLKVCHPSLCAATDDAVGAIASGFVKDLEPLLDVLAPIFTEKNLAKSIANLVRISHGRCPRCLHKFSGRCGKGLPCGCSCRQGFAKARDMEIEIGELIAQRYGVEYWPDFYWWDLNEAGGKAWYLEEQHIAWLKEKEETEKLESLRVLFQDQNVACSCSSPICRGEA